MDIKPDTWLGGVMGRDAFKVAASNGTGDAAALQRHAGGRSAFYFAKVDSADVSVTKTLTAAGFFVADVNVTFAAVPSTVPRVDLPTMEVGALRPEATEDVLAIAHDSFRFTRFHLDPHVAPATANAIKREWIRSYAEGRRGDRLFVATVGGRPAGFLAALVAKGAPESAVIDLIAVRQDLARKGIARAMIAKFADHYRSANALVVGTQVANIPSVRLYESMGFRLESSQYVLHMHVKDGKSL